MTERAELSGDDTVGSVAQAPRGPEVAVDIPPPESPSGTWAQPEVGRRTYAERVERLAQRVVDAQRPIRVLQALRWEPSVEEEFRRTSFRELPRVGPDEYAKTELGFAPASKIEEFEAIARAARDELGAEDRVGRILVATAMEYADVVRMLGARGTRAFYSFSRSLYGSPKERLPGGAVPLREVARSLARRLGAIASRELGPEEPRDIPAARAAEILNSRLSAYFGDHDRIQVDVDDAILADAAAGSDYVKIRSGARFSRRDVDVLEAHEGWVHLATSLNGQRQPVARWLAKGPPRTAAAQEGLAAMVELVSYRSHPKRARKLNDRVLAIDMAEDGADFIDVFDWYRTRGYEEDECFANTRRVFRGGRVEGGAPFTKDACYGKGLILNHAFIRAAMEGGRPELVRYLFVGKVAHEDVPVLFEAAAEGIVAPPAHVPPLFRDLNGLAIANALFGFFALATDELVGHYTQVLSVQPTCPGT